MSPTSEAGYVVEPFLHYGEAVVYNPLTDLALADPDPLYASLLRFSDAAGKDRATFPEPRDPLIAAKWLVPSNEAGAARFRLKSVQIETHTICNHACRFCPVSLSRRDNYFMPTALYTNIIRQVSVLKDTLEGVWLHNYNEPTIDTRLAELVKIAWEHGLTPCLNSNGSGLTVSVVEALLRAGGFGSIAINLSTLDPHRYAQQRGADHLELVKANLERLKLSPLAPQMHIVVVGNGDAREEADFDEIARFFEGSLFAVRHYPHNNRAAALATGVSGDLQDPRLGGCEFLGSRPLQHLTIDAYGNVVICCQDYYSKNCAGNLNTETLSSILTGAKMQALRNLVYGLLPAPSDFICRKCPFVLRRRRTARPPPDASPIAY